MYINKENYKRIYIVFILFHVKHIEEKHLTVNEFVYFMSNRLNKKTFSIEWIQIESNYAYVEYVGQDVCLRVNFIYTGNIKATCSVKMTLFSSSKWITP